MFGFNGFHSDDQRKAMFFRLGHMNSFSNSVKFSKFHLENLLQSSECNRFAKKSEDDIPEEFYGDPSLLSDKKYNELLKKGGKFKFKGKTHYISEPRVLDKADYIMAVGNEMFGIKEKKIKPKVVKLPSGKEIDVRYNLLGYPVVEDKEFHEVSSVIQSPRRSTLKPIEICDEQYCPVGLYHGVGKRDDYNVDIFMDTNMFPKDPNREGATNIKNVRKFLANSKYLDKLPTVEGIESAKNVEPLKGSEMKTEDVKVAVGKFVSEIPVTKKWDLDRDEKRENKVDKKIKEALDEFVEKKEEPKQESTSKTPILRQFTTEYKETVPESGILVTEEPKIETVIEQPKQEEKIQQEKVIDVSTMESPWSVNMPNPEYAYMVV